MNDCFLPGDLCRYTGAPDDMMYETVNFYLQGSALFGKNIILNSIIGRTCMVPRKLSKVEFLRKMFCKTKSERKIIVTKCASKTTFENINYGKFPWHHYCKSFSELTSWTRLPLLCGGCLFATAALLFHGACQ